MTNFVMNTSSIFRQTPPIHHVINTALMLHFLSKEKYKTTFSLCLGHRHLGTRLAPEWLLIVMSDGDIHCTVV